MKSALSSRTNRRRRLNLRATERQEQLIRIGAGMKGMSITDFVLESACREAEHAFANQREFTVPPKLWQAFLEALDRPARVNPKLAQLFTDHENPVQSA